MTKYIKEGFDVIDDVRRISNQADAIVEACEDEQDKLAEMMLRFDEENAGRSLRDEKTALLRKRELLRSSLASLSEADESYSEQRSALFNVDVQIATLFKLSGDTPVPRARRRLPQWAREGRNALTDTGRRVSYLVRLVLFNVIFFGAIYLLLTSL